MQRLSNQIVMKLILKAKVAALIEFESYVTPESKIKNQASGNLNHQPQSFRGARPTLPLRYRIQSSRSRPSSTAPPRSIQSAARATQRLRHIPKRPPSRPTNQRYTPPWP